MSSTLSRVAIGCAALSIIVEGVSALLFFSALTGRPDDYRAVVLAALTSGLGGMLFFIACSLTLIKYHLDHSGKRES